MKTRLLLLPLALAAVALLAAVPTAGAAVAKKPGLKVLAATGPTNLPPKQSEVQRITVGAEGGTFMLSHALAEGAGTLSYAKVSGMHFEEGSDVASLGFVWPGGELEAGQVIFHLNHERVPAGTVIKEVFEEGGVTKLRLDQVATETATATIEAGKKKITDVTGTFHPGDELVSPGLPAGTKVEVVETGALSVSDYPSQGGTVGFATPVQTTASLQFDAPAAQVQAALEALPGYEAGTFTVEGGPGGGAGTPYVIRFGGPLSEIDVAEFEATSSLTPATSFTNIATTVPGGPGTGEIGVIPVDVGGADTSGLVTLHLGPLPPGIVISGKPDGHEGKWTCTVEGSATELSCTSEDTVGALTPGPGLTVPVEVRSAVVPDGRATVSISGGGASAPASYTFPVVISAQPSKPGIASFFSEAFDADGSPSTQAGGHPHSQVTLFQLKTARSVRGTLIPAGAMRDLNVDLTAGFVGDPLVTARCPRGFVVPKELGQLTSACLEPGYVIGKLFPGIHQFGAVQFSAAFRIFNDIPAGGTAAEFGTRLVNVVASLVGSVRSEEDFGIRIASPHTNTLAQHTFSIFSAFYGEPEAAGGKAFLRNATDCAQQAREAPVVRMSASSWQYPAEFNGMSETQPAVTGCGKLSFGPRFSFQPTSTRGSAGVGATAHLHIDQSGLTDPEKLGTPDLKQSVVKLPEGLDVNPSQAAGLEACSEAQVGYMPDAAPLAVNPTRFDNNPVTCPDGSKLGTVEATSPLLEEPLKGTIYLAEQENNPFGSLIALYLVIESPRFGITLKLPGRVDTDSRTGQVTATFDYVPQQPVEDLTLRFRGGGPRSEFATPEVCGTYATQGSWTPWSAPESGPPAQTSDTFTVSSNCASSAGSRPFHPALEAGTTGTQAGVYSPLVIKVNRRDGEQELDRLDFTLPLGVLGKLAGIPYCSDQAIATAAGKSGRDERANPSCPGASRIGGVDTAAGVGSEPFHVSGDIYLAGPYKGAPVSAVVVVPAVAGPFDLGTVVVRSPLHVDLESAQVSAQSDPIPTILKGIPLKVRSVVVKIDRPQFILNPTDCEAQKFAARLGSSDGATATPSNRFQVGGCDKLKFKPHLKIRLRGATKRAGHPSLKAVVTYPKKGRYANIARAQVGLPHSEFLDQGNLNKVCRQADLKAGTCPKSSIYGHAKAWTPLLDKPLQGPVYLGVGYGYKLPALVADLNGQIRILLVGRVDTTRRHGIRSTFEVVPDAPVSRFVLRMKGGKRYGLLENSENICRKKQRASALFNAQNGLRLHMRPRIANSCKKKHRHRRRVKHGDAKHRT